MNSLTDIPFSDHYSEGETAEMAYKLFSTVKSSYKHLNPIAFEVLVTPGQFLKHLRCAEQYFNHAEVVLVCFDFSEDLDEDLITKVTSQVL